MATLEHRKAVTMGVCGRSYAITPLGSIHWGGSMEVLLVGNTDFITKQWIQHAFPETMW